MKISLLIKRLSFKLIGEIDDKLTPEQWILLKILRDNDGLPIGEIAKISMKDLPNTTRMVSKLEKLGYIEKRKCVSDNRKSFVHLLELGKKAQEEKEYIFCDVEKIASSKLTETEKKQLIYLLHKMEEGIEENFIR